jgi:hypothetical protein
MKKLLVLLLVLGLVSTASATIKELRVAVGTVPGMAPAPGEYYDPVDSQLYMNKSDLLWIGIYNATAGMAGDTGQEDMYLYFDNLAAGEWTGNGNVYRPPIPEGLGGFENIYWGPVEGYGDMWQASMYAIPASLVTIPIGVEDAKEFHCTAASGDVIVTLLDGSWEATYDTIIIHQIPEPMTIALLGLGGLFLRRRK